MYKRLIILSYLFLLTLSFTPGLVHAKETGFLKTFWCNMISNVFVGIGCGQEQIEIETNFSTTDDGINSINQEPIPVIKADVTNGTSSLQINSSNSLSNETQIYQTAPVYSTVNSKGISVAYLEGKLAVLKYELQNSLRGNFTLKDDSLFSNQVDRIYDSISKTRSELSSEISSIDYISPADLDDLTIGNASLLDSLGSTQFLRSDISNSFTAGTLTFENGTSVVIGGDTFTDLTGSGLSVSSGELTVSGLGVGNFASNSISQWNNDSNFISDLSTFDTDDLSEGTNLYYTDTRARSAFSNTATGLTYTSGTGVLSLTSGYEIPTTTSTTNWNTAYGWGDHASAGYATSSTVFGSLTSGYLPNYDGTDFTDSPIYTNGTNVGIGTNNPTVPFEIVKGSRADASLSANNGIQNIVASSGANMLSFGSGFSPNPYQWIQTMDTRLNGSSYPLSLNPAGGNVGIGTKSPSARLHTISTTEQLRSGYDSSNYWNATTGATGITTFNAVGAGSSFVFSDNISASNLSGTNTGDVTVTDSSELDFTLAGQNITAALIAASIDILKLDAGVQSSLGLADSALQNGSNISELTNDSGYITSYTETDTLADVTGRGATTATQSTFSGGLLSGLGTALLPSYSFSGDTNTGMWSPTVDTLAWSTGGSERMRTTADGNFGIGTASPTQKLEVTGTATSNSLVKMGTLEFQPYSLGNAWIGENVYYNGGFLRRGAGAAGLFYFHGNEGQFRFADSGSAGSNAGIDGKAQFKVNANGTIALGANVSNLPGNYTGASFILNSSGNVGIGTISPSEKLDVAGSITVSGPSGSFINMGSSGSSIPAGLAYGMYARSTDGLGIHSNAAGIALSTGFAGGAAVRAKITADGFIVQPAGLTVNPSAAIHTISTTEQLRLGYNSSNYWSNTISSTGGLTMQGVGTGGALTLSPTAGQNVNLSLSGAGDFAVNTNQLYVDTSTGYVGIGVSAPSQKLHVNGNARFEGVGSGAFAFELNLTADGTLTTSSSDERLKSNIESIDSAETLEKILLLNPTTFTWKSNDANDLGLIAQEVEEIFPELVFTNPTDGFKGINYSRLPALLISAVQEISKKLAGIMDGTLDIFANTLRAKSEICIEDVCIDKAQLQQLINNETTSTNQSSGSDGSSQDSGTNEDSTPSENQPDSQPSDPTSGDIPEETIPVSDPESVDPEVDPSSEETETETDIAPEVEITQEDNVPVQQEEEEVVESSEEVEQDTSESTESNEVVE